MLASLLILVIVALTAFSLAKSFSRKAQLSDKQFSLVFVLAFSLLLILGLILFGRLPIQYIFAPIGVALTFLLRMLPRLAQLMPLGSLIAKKLWGNRRSGQHKSIIRAEFLTMEIDHDSGEMEGKVLKGSFKDRLLSTLDIEQLICLLEECTADDESRRILKAYMQRSRTRPQGGWGHGDSGEDGAVAEGSMDRKLALEILGLDEQASSADIRTSYRQLMAKLHPDRGGSDYLAKKINAAKDFLLRDG